MNSNADLIKEAIADAKILRTTAMENVKQILGPYFENKLNEVFDKAESLDGKKEEVVADENKDQKPEGKADNASADKDKDAENLKEEKPAEDATGDEVITNKDIEDIIASLKEDLNKAEDGAAEDKKSEEISKGEVSDDEKTSTDPESTTTPKESEDGDTIDIEELVKELELEDGKEEGEAVVPDEVDNGEKASGEETEEVTLESLLDLNEGVPCSSSDIGKSTEKSPVNPSSDSNSSSGIGTENKDHVIKKLQRELVEAKQKLEEALKANDILKNNLAEVNLLNAKLFYSARLFKDHAMTPEQKKKVIEMIDLSESVKDAKRIYTVILETLSFGAKQGNQNKQMVSTIAEGIHSAPVGSTAPQKEIITEADKSGIVERMKRLAGIS